jgi:hypothetical protein
MERLKKLGLNPETFAAWNRPLRSYLWAILIAHAVIQGTEISEWLIVAMYTDLGVYSVLRTYEKTKTN